MPCDKWFWKKQSWKKLLWMYVESCQHSLRYWISFDFFNSCTRDHSVIYCCPIFRGSNITSTNILGRQFQNHFSTFWLVAIITPSNCPDPTLSRLQISNHQQPHLQRWMVHELHRRSLVKLQHRTTRQQVLIMNCNMPDHETLPVCFMFRKHLLCLFFFVIDRFTDFELNSTNIYSISIEDKKITFISSKSFKSLPNLRGAWWLCGSFTIHRNNT
jgi:hypothetical protein